MPQPDHSPATGFDITVDGVRVPVRPGQTVAAVLLGGGRLATRRTRIEGRPRGVFCGIGTCFDCLVVCNGEPGVRSCLRPVAPGDVIETGTVIETGVGAYGTGSDRG
ncbi:(2Fe-2S)-binding protein [Micromonospora sp. NBC_01796]|uniref:(2Fe-2S)-binding protein n=1 Tax=Micromonospora sp. NBC_01796 TaxID=2975987 RepID=UPI002DD7A382|nr:(2Fe-2S)-binding protein [Micromonospora sp. NBC_01796]WSA86460.1 (2Fe-2S)-binding protein [Micromonospora sp. NBC_01796]